MVGLNPSWVPFFFFFSAVRLVFLLLAVGVMYFDFELKKGICSLQEEK